MTNPVHNQHVSQGSTLGLSLMDGGGVFNAWSATAETMKLLILDSEDSSKVLHEILLEAQDDGIFSGAHDGLLPGTNYVLRADGPKGQRHAFDPTRNLLDPYAKGLVRQSPSDYYCVAVQDDFDWQGVSKPGTKLAESVIYEAHLRGLTRLNPQIPEEIRGSYAALGHPATIDYLTRLGITAIELLPIQAFISEPRLINLGLINYWGYNTINYFTPHMRYSSKRAREDSPLAILRELKTAIRELHRAGIEVILDVVYNHTAEGGAKGLTFSYRGLDNSSYYRQDDQGNYQDTTGCGNSLDFGKPMVQRLMMDSLRYWVNDMQIDGFRFDLATTLARDEQNHFTPDHEVLQEMKKDPVISSAKLIVEPWDVGMGGWQTGNFPPGFPEWNDQYRDSIRKFWLTDIKNARETGSHDNGVQDLAGKVSGSQEVVSQGSPVGSLNFVTAHDGFTLWDLVSYNQKHNLANGEASRDGSGENFSFNHGHEGPTSNNAITLRRAKAARNLLGTLLTSAGVPMIRAGDERLKSQDGNNNAYCQDNAITWQEFESETTKDEFFTTVSHLIGLRKQYPALRPSSFTKLDEATDSHDQMLWYSITGEQMSVHDWHNPERRTLQRLNFHLTPDGQRQGILLAINGAETVKEIRLPELLDNEHFELVWDSAEATPVTDKTEYRPGSTVSMVEASMKLFAVR